MTKGALKTHLKVLSILLGMIGFWVGYAVAVFFFPLLFVITAAAGIFGCLYYVLYRGLKE